MKNTATGNHAGPVGSITTSKRVPAGAPSNPHNSIADKLSTVGTALRFASVLPSSSRTRTECADAIPKSIPTSRLQLIVFSLEQNGTPRHRLARATTHASATVPTLNRPTAAPTHVLQTDPTSKDRPTSLIRDIRGQVECDDQIDEAKPSREPLSARNDVTTRTSREGNPTLRPRPRGGSPSPVLVTCADDRRRESAEPVGRRACRSVCYRPRP